jgi:hypothetical protein
MTKEAVFISQVQIQATSPDYHSVGASVTPQQNAPMEQQQKRNKNGSCQMLLVCPMIIHSWWHQVQQL